MLLSNSTHSSVLLRRPLSSVMVTDFFGGTARVELPPAAYQAGSTPGPADGGAAAQRAEAGESGSGGGDAGAGGANSNRGSEEHGLGPAKQPAQGAAVAVLQLVSADGDAGSGRGAGPAAARPGGTGTCGHPGGEAGGGMHVRSVSREAQAAADRWTGLALAFLLGLLLMASAMDRR